MADDRPPKGLAAAVGNSPFLMCLSFFRSVSFRHVVVPQTFVCFLSSFSRYEEPLFSMIFWLG